MSQSQPEQTMMPAAKVTLAKVVLNIAPGKSGEMVERAAKVLETLTEQKPSQRKAMLVTVFPRWRKAGCGS